MNRRGAGRRRLLVALCPGDRPVIDVGADHGHVAHALGAIATERLPHRIGRRDVRWVVADGLTPFREVPVAIIAGLGARSIEQILERGPRPGVLVAHAPDDPGRLRCWLAAHGWRIDAEGLAREGHRFAEVLRAVSGHERATGLELELGPRLLAGEDPLLRAWMTHNQRYWSHLAARTAVVAPDVADRARERAAFLREHLERRGWPVPVG